MDYRAVASNTIVSIATFSLISCYDRCEDDSSSDDDDDHDDVIQVLITHIL